MTQMYSIFSSMVLPSSSIKLIFNHAYLIKSKYLETGKIISSYYTVLFLKNYQSFLLTFLEEDKMKEKIFCACLQSQY